MSAATGVLTITCNPAVDITYDIDVLRLHEAHRVRSVHKRAGGKGVNVARVLQRLGHPVTATGLLGGPGGDEVRALLPEGIRQEWVATATPTRSTVALVDPDGVSLFNEPGAEVSQTDWRSLVQRASELAATHAVTAISGSLPAGTSAEVLSELIRSVRSAGSVLAVDTSGSHLVTAAKAGADLLKPNKEELFEATGATEIEAGVAVLLDRGAGAVLLSDGSHGMGLYTRRKGHLMCWWATPGRVVRGNATGAGDASVAAVVKGLAAHGPDMNWPEALADAVALSGATVLAPTAGDFDEAAYESLRPLVKVEERHAPR